MKTQQERREERVKVLEELTVKKQAEVEELIKIAKANIPFHGWNMPSAIYELYKQRQSLMDGMSGDINLDTAADQAKRIQNLTAEINQAYFSEHTFEVGGKTYQLTNGAVFIKDRKFQAHEILADERIREYLVAIGSGSVKEIQPLNN